MSDVRRWHGRICLDWSKARMGHGPCQDCGKPAMLIDPVTRKPAHKVCAEERMEREAR